MDDYKRASREFALEVDQETARLIKDGMPPWDAVEEARRRVSKRRFEQRMKQSDTNWEGSDR